MNFKLLPMLLAAMICEHATAQSPARLSAFSVKVQTGSTVTSLDTVKYSYFSTHGGVPYIEASFNKRYYPDYIHNRPIDYRGIVSLSSLEFSHAENHRANTLETTVPFYKETKTYNAAGLLDKHEQYVDTTFYWYQPLYPGTKKLSTTYTYNSSGNLILKEEKSLNIAGATLATKKDSFSYNTAGKLVHIFKYQNGILTNATDLYFTGNAMDSIFDYYSKRYYTYNGAHVASFREDFHSLVYSYLVHTKFNTVGLPIEDSMTIIDHGVPRAGDKYQYTYNTNGDLILSENGPYAYFMNYDANHNMLSLHHRSISGTDTFYTYRHEFTYNSLNLIEKYVQKDWDSASASWVPPAVDTQRYYYYSSIASVNKVPATQLQCSIYPVPATAMLNIDISNGKENETAFEVYSTDGRLVRRMVVKTVANGKYAIPVADLSAGTYILHSKNGEMENVKQFTVLR